MSGRDAILAKVRASLAAGANGEGVVDGPAQFAGRLARADALAQGPGERRFDQLAIQVVESA